MDEKHQTKSFFRERKIGRIFLYIELFYALLLGYSLMFAFSLFAHLVLGQFIIAGSYFLAGWIYVRYLKIRGRLPDDGKGGKKESFRQKNADFWSQFDSRFFYNSTELITVLLGCGAFSWIFVYTYTELFLDARNLNPVNSLIGYLSFALGVVVFFNVAGILFGKQYFVRKCAIIELVLSLVLILIYPAHWLTMIFVIITAASSLFLFIKNKI